MNKNELLKKLKELQDDRDTESAHSDADDLLVEYIGDDEIANEYGKIRKWYA